MDIQYIDYNIKTLTNILIGGKITVDMVVDNYNLLL